MFRSLRIFFLAHFTDAACWRLQHKNGKESELLSRQAAICRQTYSGGKLIIDFSHYNRIA